MRCTNEKRPQQNTAAKDAWSISLHKHKKHAILCSERKKRDKCDDHERSQL